MRISSPTILIGFLCFALLAGCSTTPDRSPTIYAPTNRPISQGDLEAKLNQHYRVWEGTPHEMGGLNRQGIDCSGFVFVTYRDVLGMKLPRSTDTLAKTGKEVPLSQIKTGDLLIFKTGIKQKHVGIYIGGGEFIHASSSNGVMSSNIQSPYWTNAYRQARRVVGS